MVPEAFTVITNPQHSLLGSSTFHSPIGKKLKITVVEGNNLARKDRSRKNDPYIKLQYGKVGSPISELDIFCFLELD